MASTEGLEKHDTLGWFVPKGLEAGGDVMRQGKRRKKDNDHDGAQGGEGEGEGSGRRVEGGAADEGTGGASAPSDSTHNDEGSTEHQHQHKRHRGNEDKDKYKSGINGDDVDNHSLNSSIELITPPQALFPLDVSYSYSCCQLSLLTRTYNSDPIHPQLISL